MQDRVDPLHVTIHRRLRLVRRKRSARVSVAIVVAMLASCAARAGEMMPGMGSMVADPGAPPTTEMGGGSYFFAQDLGTMLRVGYDTESYGQDADTGTLNIGTMQMLNFDDSAVFVDGQVTLNDPNGVGFNLGVGYRWMSFQPYASAAGRMQGVSIWADGTSTEANNFFPQVGVSYESLGELWDLRANGYIPVGQDTQVGDFDPTGEVGFEGNSISQLTQATVDSSFYVGEAELAARLLSNRDAWAFAGPYFLANDNEDTLGYRAGVRGYAFPDLLLQIAVSNDDIFETNAAFSVVWFVGRTRTHFQPACGVPDRFREPVMRNDYVALAQSTLGGGVPLTDAVGEELRIVHIDSAAAPGGDGSFENPFDMLTDANGAGSLEGDILLVHSNSVFTGESGVTLKDDQRLLGEGLDAAGNPLVHTVVTFEEGTIDIPESALGARNQPRPMIVDAIGDAITLANSNEVGNFDIEGGDSAIAGMNITENTNLHDLSIIDTLMDAIALDTVSEDIRLVEIDITNPGGTGISLANIATTSAVTLDEFTYDGGAGPASGLELNNFDGTFTATDSTFTGGTGDGVAVLGGSDGSITFQDTVTFNNIDGDTFDVNGFTGTLTVNSDITNDMGRSVSIQALSEASTTATFSGDIMDSGMGILVNNNTDGTILFTGDLTLNTGANDAITVTGNNTNADINFAGLVDITTTTGDGFVANGGGTLTVSGTTNSISSTAGRLVDIQGMTISNASVNFSELNRSGAGTSSAVLLQTNTGGPIVLGTVGDDAGESGMIAAGTGNAIEITNSANVTVSGLEIASSAGTSGVRVEKSNAVASTINLNDLEINAGAIGVEVVGGGTGALTMTVNDTAINSSTDAGLLVNNVDAGTIQANNLDVDGNNVNGTADGVRIQNSDATITFNDQTSIQEFGDNDVEVSGGAGTISFAGDIRNSSAAPTLADTTGNSVNVHNVTGGTINFTAASSINDDNEGMLIEDNTGGTFNFLSDHDLNTGANTAVTIDNNSGATISLSNLNIDTTTGTGFLATNGGTLTVLGTTNTIDSIDGVALQIQDMTIGNAGVDFQTINVTSGNTNAILLEDLAGTGLVSIGDSTGAPDSGGTLTTTNEAVILRNVANVDLNNIRVADAGATNVLIEHSAAGANAMDVTIDGLNLDDTIGTGISVLGDNTNAFNLRLTDGDLENNVDIDITGSGAFGLLVDNVDINTAATADIAFALDFSGSAQNGDVTFRNTSGTNTNDFLAGSGSALSITSSGGSAKTIDLLVEEGLFSNSSPTNPAANFVSSGNTLLNATIRDNTFDNADAAGSDFTMTASGAQARIRLNLGDDDPARFNNAAGNGEFNLIEDAGADFDVFDRADTFAGLRNTGTVVPQSPAGIPNAAAFDDSPVAPPLPIAP
jgi:hypothetical protein